MVALILSFRIVHSVCCSQPFLDSCIPLFSVSWCNRKFLWLRLEAPRVYRCTPKHLENTLATLSFSKVTIACFILGLMICPAMSFWPGFRTQLEIYSCRAGLKFNQKVVRYPIKIIPLLNTLAYLVWKFGIAEFTGQDPLCLPLVYFLLH